MVQEIYQENCYVTKFGRDHPPQHEASPSSTLRDDTRRAREHVGNAPPVLRELSAPVGQHPSGELLRLRPEAFTKSNIFIKMHGYPPRVEEDNFDLKRFP